MIVLLTALAGGVGAASRFLVDTLVARHNRLGLPLGTVVVNVTACFLLGLLTGLLANAAPSVLTSVLGIGFLGGYSTFSTASVEGFRLLRDHRPWTALAHTGGMLVASLAAAALGLALAPG